MTRTRWMTIAAGLAGCLLANAAGAGPDHTNDEHADSKTDFEFVSIDNDDKYEIIVRDGETIARVNGVRIDDDLIETRDNKVIILGNDGKVLKEVVVGGPRGGVFAGTPRPPRPAAAPRVYRFGFPGEAEEMERAIAAERPPVMMGVLLESPSDALRAHLDLPEHALVLEKIMEGLPAEKAGLRQWDIIIEVNGDPMDDQRVLHEALMESTPGDELDLVVIRKGDEIEIEMELEAYDAQKLGTPSMTTTIEVTPGEEADFPFGLTNRWRQGENDEVKRALEETMRRLEELGAAGQNEDIARKFREQMEQMQRQLGAQAEQLRRSRAFTLDNGRLIIDDDDREAMADELEARLEDLEDQFEDRLESLEERMEERWERMERVFDRMLDRVEQMLEKRRDDRG